MIKNDLNMRFFVEPQGNADEIREPTPQEKADEMVRDAERSRARVFDLGGNNTNCVNLGMGGGNPASAAGKDLMAMDNDYQMLDSHIDDAMKKKIWALEYIDFSKLLVKNRASREEDQCLEIVSRNGMTFLSPVFDREHLQINSYGKWEQAFRVFSNVLTTKFPGKSPELLQYNHTIHSAASSYVWENVYAYDREFRRHIARYPTRAWNVILQQAWTMLLKDRLKNDHGMFKKGGKSKKEFCKRFNKGRCTFGPSCIFEHRCSVPEGGKYGHGAFNCRLKKDKQTTNSGGLKPVQELGSKD